MNDNAKVLYTGKTSTRGGRQGSARSDDGHLDIALSPPGAGGPGTNPEQLFAAGWSACFIGALGHAARAKEVRLPPETAVDAEVDLCHGQEGYFLRARLHIHLPGLPADIAQVLVDIAHQTCPYSKASRGNVATTLTIA